VQKRAIRPFSIDVIPLIVIIMGRLAALMLPIKYIKQTIKEGGPLWFH